MKVRKIVAGLAAVSMLAAFSAQVVAAADTVTVTASKVEAKAGEEVRGVAMPEEINGQWMYTITVASNASGEDISLYYYCDKLHRIFSTYWTRFDATLPPTGSDDIYQPAFVK